MKLHQLALAACAALSMGVAHADSFTLSGTLLATDATFARPTTLTSVSAVGTAVHYDTYTFGGVTPGSYNFLMTGTYDTFLALYAGTFTASTPLTNLVALNDDFNGSLTSSGFTYTLAANTLYTVVSTAYANTGLGTYTTTITSAVPEPETVALLLAGLGAVGFMARRRQAAV